MSGNVKIETSSPNQLQGGVTNETRRGNETNRKVTDSMAFGSSRFCKGDAVTSSSSQQSPVAPNTANGAGSREHASVSGLSVTGREQERATPVDRRTIVGSQPGDSRRVAGDTAKASLTQASEGDGSGPRSHAGQAGSIGRSGTTNGSFGNNYHSQSWPEEDAGD